MSATVGDLKAALNGIDDFQEVRIDAQTKHNSLSTGIYLRVSVKAGPVEILNMVSDNRNEVRSLDQDQAWLESQN